MMTTIPLLRPSIWPRIALGALTTGALLFAGNNLRVVPELDDPRTQAHFAGVSAAGLDARGGDPSGQRSVKTAAAAGLGRP